MKPSEFHNTQVEIIGALEEFLKTFRTMLLYPSKGFANALKSKGRGILPGAFLFINLAIAELLPWPSSFSNDDLKAWGLRAAKEAPEHIIGTLLLLFLFKISFRKVKSTKLFTILCLSSIVFVPHAVVAMTAGWVIGPDLLSFWTFALSGHYKTVSDILAPLLPIGYKVIGFSSAIVLILIWWFWLISIGFAKVSDLPRPERIFRIGLSVTGYVVTFILVFLVVFCTAMISMLRGYTDYEKMREAFKKQDYTEAFVLAKSVTSTSSMLPVGKYRAYLIGGISQLKIFCPDDTTFQDAIVAINNEKYHDGELAITNKLKARLLSQEDPIRILLKNMESSIEEARKQYNSPLYSEAKTQEIRLFLSPADIPIHFFP